MNQKDRKQNGRTTGSRPRAHRGYILTYCNELWKLRRKVFDFGIRSSLAEGLAGGYKELAG